MGDSILVLKQQGPGRSYQRPEGVCARGRGRGLCAETGSLVCTGVPRGVHLFFYNPTASLDCSLPEQARGPPRILFWRAELRRFSARPRRARLSPSALNLSPGPLLSLASRPIQDGIRASWSCLGGNLDCAMFLSF